jgi:hypothetical protein
MVALVCILVLLVVVIGVWLSDRPAPVPAPTSYHARAAIRDIERQTLDAMLAAEREAQVNDGISDGQAARDRWS